MPVRRGPWRLHARTVEECLIQLFSGPNKNCDNEPGSETLSAPCGVETKRFVVCSARFLEHLSVRSQADDMLWVSVSAIHNCRPGS